MKKIVGKRAALAGVALAGATAITGAAAQSGSAVSAVHVLDFVSRSTAIHGGDNGFFGADTDRHQGRIIGYDTLSGVFYAKPKAHVIGDLAVALKRGFIYLHFRQGLNPSFDGTVTGGTGKYAGVTGTFHGLASQTSRSTHITVHYQL